MSADDAGSIAAALVDRIVLEQDGRSREISLAEFLELPLNVRVRHLIERKVTFFKDGLELNAQRVLAKLREANVKAPRSPRTR